MAPVVLKESDCVYRSVEILRTASPTTLHLKGELDLGSAQEASEALVELETEAATPVFVDLTHVSFMDCSGLSVLVGAYNRACRDDRQLIITNPQPPVRRIFNLTGCKHLIADPERETLKA